MIHVIIERPDLAEAIADARKIYNTAVRVGRHVLLDAPGNFECNLPDRRLSAVDVMISARVPTDPGFTNKLAANAAA